MEWDDGQWTHDVWNIHGTTTDNEEHTVPLPLHKNTEEMSFL